MGLALERLNVTNDFDIRIYAAIACVSKSLCAFSCACLSTYVRLCIFMPADRLDVMHSQRDLHRVRLCSSFRRFANFFPLFVYIHEKCCLPLTFIPFFALIFSLF